MHHLRRIGSRLALYISRLCFEVIQRRPILSIALDPSYGGCITGWGGGPPPCRMALDVPDAISSQAMLICTSVLCMVGCGVFGFAGCCGRSANFSITSLSYSESEELHWSDSFSASICRLRRFWWRFSLSRWLWMCLITTGNGNFSFSV